MNTKFYKEYQDRYPTILGSDRNISYVTFLEEFVTELQNQVKLLIIGDVMVSDCDHNWKEWEDENCNAQMRCTKCKIEKQYEP